MEIAPYIELARQSLEIFRKLVDQPGRAYAYNTLGELSRTAGDYEAAQRYYEKNLRIGQLSGNRMGESLAYLNLGYTYYHRKQHQLSAELVKQAIVIFQELGSRWGLIDSLAVLAGPTNELGDHERAARLLGASDAAAKSLGYNSQPGDQMEIEQFKSSTRQALGEEAFREVWQDGHKLSLEEAVEYALQNH